ncbi:MAG TPA: hypothetical protein VFQ45_09080 [Longimicrobium sp.]|nr:hypothetical protein [Longimicrobium sp.]
MSDARERRIGEVVGRVARQALADYGRSRIALLDDGGPEAELAARMLARALGDEAVVRVAEAEGEMDPLLHAAPPERVGEETRRMRARLLDDALPAHPANKTALLLGGSLPPEPLLPLGDLWAGEVAALIGSWSASADVRALAEAAGGVEVLDAALRRWIDQREPAALASLPAEAAERVRRLFAAGSASRRNPRLVPKLGHRTLCVDLSE